MLKTVETNWRLLRAGEPGRRFMDRYQRNRARRSCVGPWRRCLNVGGGAAICGAGLFFMPAPGPGCAIFLLGAALLSGELRFMACLLDWAELRARPAFLYGKAHWRRCSLGTKTAVLLTAAASCAAVALVVYVGWWNGP